MSFRWKRRNKKPLTIEQSIGWKMDSCKWSLFAGAHILLADVSVFPKLIFLSQLIRSCPFPIIECNFYSRGKYKVLTCPEKKHHKVGIHYLSFYKANRQKKQSVVLWWSCKCAFQLCTAGESNWPMALTWTSPVSSWLYWNYHLLPQPLSIVDRPSEVDHS